MDSSKLENIWKLISDYNLKVAPDSSAVDMSCNICRKMMTVACHSLCGCQFCHKCISEYIGNGNKYCPGNNIKCKQEVMCLETDIMRDTKMNNRIYKSIVLCPNESCHTQIELSEMHEHLRVCNSQLTECPYKSIGCDNGKVRESTHLHDERVKHEILVLESIDNLRNEMNGLKSAFEMSRAEILSLKEELKRKDMQMRGIIETVMKQNTQLESMNEESVRKENLIAKLEEQLMEVHNEIEIRLSVITKETEKIKREVERQIDSMFNDEIMVTEDEMELFTELNEENNKIKSDYNINFKSDQITKSIKSRCDSEFDFIWRINEWTKKMETMRGRRIYSDSFYLDNYKLYLFLYHGSNDAIGFGCIIMKGNNDEMVQWPMRRAVILSIVNQDTQEAYNSITLSYDAYKYKSTFNRPGNNMNRYAIGSHSIIDYSLKYNPSIVVNDSIILSCSLGNS